MYRRTGRGWRGHGFDLFEGSVVERGLVAGVILIEGIKGELDLKEGNYSLLSDLVKPLLHRLINQRHSRVTAGVQLMQAFVAPLQLLRQGYGLADRVARGLYRQLTHFLVANQGPSVRNVIHDPAHSSHANLIAAQRLTSRPNPPVFIHLLVGRNKTR